jgi:hypothetical protein
VTTISFTKLPSAVDEGEFELAFADRLYVARWRVERGRIVVVSDGLTVSADVGALAAHPEPLARLILLRRLRASNGCG